MSADSVLATFNKAIDRVLKEPIGPKRWRAANDMWLTLSPSNKTVYQQVVSENKQMRDSLLETRKKFLASDDKNSTLRLSLNIPAGAYYTIERADPDVFKKESNAAKFFKEFKEYTVAEAR